MQCYQCKNLCKYLPIRSRSPTISIVDQLPSLPNDTYIDGDIVIIASTGDMYTLENGIWVFQGSLRGPPGQPGYGSTISFITDENHSNFPPNPNPGDVVVFLPYGQTYTFIDDEWVLNTTIGIINEVNSCVDEMGIIQRKAKGILIDDDEIENLDYVTAPKGEGANIAQFPDGTIENGDCRGPYSTDFQKLRTSPDQVSNGLASGILSGQNNITEGDNSGILTGINNRTKGDNSSISSGNDNETQGENSGIVSGNNNTTQSNNSGILTGINNRTEGDNSGIMSGSNNQTKGDNSGILTGINNRTEGDNSGIVSGSNNQTEGDNSFIGSGNFNTVDENSINSNVVSGNKNTITNSSNSSTLVGNNTNITNSDNSNILSGEQVNINNSDNSIINSTNQGEINNSIYSKISNTQQSQINNSDFSSVNFSNQSNIIGEVIEYLGNGRQSLFPTGSINITGKFIQRDDVIFLYIYFDFVYMGEQGYDSLFIPLVNTGPGIYQGSIPRRRIILGVRTVFYSVEPITLLTNVEPPVANFINFSFLNITPIPITPFNLQLAFEQIDPISTSNNHINNGDSNSIVNGTGSVIISGDQNLVGTITHNNNLMFGTGLMSVNDMSVTFGQYNDIQNILYPLPGSEPIGTTEGSPCEVVTPSEIVFCISYGTSNDDRKNLFVVNRRGDVWARGTFFTSCS